MPGLWLDCSVMECTAVGCDVCGWKTTGDYATVRDEWLSHSHDPLFDVRYRARQERARKTEHLAELAEIVARRLEAMPPDAALWERAQAAVAALDEAGIVFARMGCWDG